MNNNIYVRKKIQTLCYDFEQKISRVVKKENLYYFYKNEKDEKFNKFVFAYDKEKRQIIFKIRKNSFIFDLTSDLYSTYDWIDYKTCENLKELEKKILNKI